MYVHMHMPLFIYVCKCVVVVVTVHAESLNVTFSDQRFVLRAPSVKRVLGFSY